MLTPDEVDEYFHKFERPGFRWLFRPKYSGPLSSHVYGLTFIVPERRFALSRMKIVPFVQVDDADLLNAFRSQLSDMEIASCTREAMKPPPHEDDVPF